MKKYIFILIGVITILGVIAFVAFKSLDSNIETAQKDPKFEQMPQIISKVKTLEIINARIDNSGSSDAIVIIDVKNNSPRPIIAITVESGNAKESSGKIIGSFVDPPLIIGKPFEIFTIKISLSDVVNGLPIRVSGAIYADGSGDGEEKALYRIRKSNEKARQNMKKGGSE